MSRERRVGRADALPLLPVAGSAGKQSSRWIPKVIKRQAVGGHAVAGLERQGRIMNGNAAALFGSEFPRDPAHLLMVAPAIRIGLELPLQIAGVEPRQPRRTSTISLSFEPMAGDAGVGGARSRAAERDQPARFRKPVERFRIRLRAPSKRNGNRERNELAHRVAILGRSCLFLPILLSAAACKPPPDNRQAMPIASAAHGKAAIERVGCASCHVIPGVGWPQGKVGPNLTGLSERGLIAGRLANRPDVLAAYIRNAPALVPNSAMPAMPVTESEARDIAAYLYEQGAR